MPRTTPVLQGFRSAIDTIPSAACVDDAVVGIDGWFESHLAHHAGTARAIEAGDAEKAAMPRSRCLVSTAPSYLAARPAPVAGTPGQAVPAVWKK